ncbi:MAG: class I SAM-dependent methyltransferase [Chloroflexi bacterium]|nr:class I SAM-dependent methyltransferase [Chloroflexota bacterium]
MNRIRQNLLPHLARPGRGFWGWLALQVMIRRNQRMNGWGVDLLMLQPSDHVLEVGFGSGATIKRMARIVMSGKVAGVDHSEVAVERAARRNWRGIHAGRVELTFANAVSLPYEAEQFDKVLSTGTLYYLTDPVVVLQEIRRVLKPGGRVAIMVRAPAALKKNPVFASGQYPTYEADEVLGLLHEAGFEQAWIADSPPDGTIIGVMGVK